MSNEKKIVFCLDSDCYDVSTHASCEAAQKLTPKGLKIEQNKKRESITLLTRESRCCAAKMNWMERTDRTGVTITSFLRFCQREVQWLRLFWFSLSGWYARLYCSMVSNFDWDTNNSRSMRSLLVFLCCLILNGTFSTESKVVWLCAVYLSAFKIVTVSCPVCVSDVLCFWLEYG